MWATHVTSICYRRRFFLRLPLLPRCFLANEYETMEEMESRQYPVREGEPDCSHYIRTGQCKYGATCRYNHPPDRKQAVDAASIKGEYPEKIGQPECQNEMECAYYMRNGLCKFGSTCKFHHPLPSNMMVSLHGSSVYPPIHSPTTLVSCHFPRQELLFVRVHNGKTLTTSYASGSGVSPRMELIQWSPGFYFIFRKSAANCREP